MEVPSGRVITLGARAEVYSLLGGWSSLLSQPVATSEFSGSGRSQSRHCMMRLPLPPGGNARIKNAPQSGTSDGQPGPCDNFAAGSKARQTQTRKSPKINRGRRAEG